MKFVMDMVMILLCMLVVVAGFTLLDVTLLNAHFINKLRHKLGMGDLE
jgi:ABC-type siderophore export system fused ATPase/permease subunit